MQRREAFVFDKRGKESSAARAPKTKREEEREHLRMREKTARKGGGKGKRGTSSSPERGIAVTLILVEYRRGSERGLNVGINGKLYGVFWSENLNIEAYHNPGKVTATYQKLAQALVNAFDLETRSFTNESVETEDCTWTLQKQ